MVVGRLVRRDLRRNHHNLVVIRRRPLGWGLHRQWAMGRLAFRIHEPYNSSSSIYSPMWQQIL